MCNVYLGVGWAYIGGEQVLEVGGEHGAGDEHRDEEVDGVHEARAQGLPDGGQA